MKQLKVYQYALAHVEHRLEGMMYPEKRNELENERDTLYKCIAEIEARDSYIEKAFGAETEGNE